MADSPFSNLGEKLKTKVGPLPAWAWVVGLTAMGAVVVYYLKSRASNTTAPASALNCPSGTTPDPTNTYCIPTGTNGSTDTSSVPGSGGGGTITITPTGSGNGVTGNQQTNCGVGTQLDPTGTFCIPTSVLSPSGTTSPTPTVSPPIASPVGPATTPVNGQTFSLTGPPAASPTGPSVIPFSQLTQQQQSGLPAGTTGVSEQELAYLQGGAAGETAFLQTQQPATIQTNSGGLLQLSPIPQPTGPATTSPLALSSAPTGCPPGTVGLPGLGGPGQCVPTGLPYGAAIPSASTGIGGSTTASVAPNSGGGCPAGYARSGNGQCIPPGGQVTGVVPPGFRGCTNLSGVPIPCP